MHAKGVLASPGMISKMLIADETLMQNQCMHGRVKGFLQKSRQMMQLFYATLL